MNEQKHFIWGDVLRVLAMTMVLFLHAAAPYVDRFDQVPLSRWVFANLVNAITRPSVPLFFMLSGMLLLKKQSENPLLFFRKRFARILPPLLFWSVVYIFWGSYHHQRDYNLGSGVKAILQGDVRFHLWFVYVLIGLYLITPLLRVLIQKLGKGFLLVGLLVWLAVFVVAPLLARLTAFENPWQVDLLVLEYLGYFLLGHLLGQVRLSSKLNKVFWIGIWGAAAVFTGYCAYAYSVERQALFGFFYNYTNLNVVVMSTALFLIAKSLDFDTFFARFPKLKPVLLQLSAISYGMYIGHVLFQEILWENWPDWIGTHPLLIIPAVAVSVGAITTIFLLAAGRIPVLRRMVN